MAGRAGNGRGALSGAIIAAVGVLLLLVELLLPTGGVLALIGAGGLVAAGIVSLNEDNAAADYVGPGLITLGVISIITFFIITPKLIRKLCMSTGMWLTSRCTVIGWPSMLPVMVVVM